MKHILTLLTALLGAAIAAPASATVYDYVYQGFPVGRKLPDGSWVSCEVDRRGRVAAAVAPR